MAKRESTSLNIDPELWKKAKITAITNEMTLTDLVEKALNECITELEKGK